MEKSDKTVYIFMSLFLLSTKIKLIHAFRNQDTVFYCGEKGSDEKVA